MPQPGFFAQHGEDVLKDKFIPGINGHIFKVDGLTPERLLQEFTDPATETLNISTYEQCMYSKLTEDVLTKSNVYIRVEPFNDVGYIFQRTIQDTESKNISLYVMIKYWDRRFGWMDQVEDGLWEKDDPQCSLSRVENPQLASKIKSSMAINKAEGMDVFQGFRDGIQKQLQVHIIDIND